MSKAKSSVVTLISGNGSNLQALIDAAECSDANYSVKAVISNNSKAYGLQRAKNARITFAVVDDQTYPDRQHFETALKEKIDSFFPDLIVLAGFMRILSLDFVNHYQNRMLNIHPSLLPKYKGLNTHQRVIDNGEKVHGASVHFVTGELDGGPIVIQGQIMVANEDTPESLQERVHRIEHKILPQAASWYAAGRLSVKNGKVLLDGKLRTEQGLVDID